VRKPPDDLLLPCPLCGSSAAIEHRQFEDDLVICDLCGCNVPGITTVAAITKWNNRELAR